MVNHILQHNHECCASAEEVQATATRRFIPPEIEEIAHWYSGFLMPSVLHNAMVHMAMKQNIPITWELRDVQNRFGRKIDLWDCDKFVKSLPQLHVFSDFENDECGVLSHALWSLNDDRIDEIVSYAK